MTWDRTHESWLMLSKALRLRWLEETACSRKPPSEALAAAVEHELAERQLYGGAIAEVAE